MSSVEGLDPVENLSTTHTEEIRAAFAFINRGDLPPAEQKSLLARASSAIDAREVQGAIFPGDLDSAARTLAIERLRGVADTTDEIGEQL